MNRTSSTRNSYIELCRFIAAIVMVFHHTEKLASNVYLAQYRIAPGGWIFVEYFFILSGYFMTRHFYVYKIINECPEKIAVLYTIEKILKLLPYAAVGILVDTIAKIGCGDISVLDIGNVIAELPAHFLFLKGLNITNYEINGPLWYLTGILVAMPILICALLHFSHFYQYIACWLFPMVLYAVSFAAYGNIQYWGEYWSINCMLRAFAGLLLGSLVFYLSEYMKSLKLTTSLKKLLSILEVILFIGLVLLPFSIDCLSYAIPCVLISLVTLCIAFSQQEQIQAYIPKWINRLGKLSMPMYCIHLPIYNLVRWLCPGLSFKLKLWIGFGLVLLLSGILISLTDRIPVSHSKAKQ